MTIFSQQLTDPRQKFIFNPILYKTVGRSQADNIVIHLMLKWSDPSIKLLFWQLHAQLFFTLRPSDIGQDAPCIPLLFAAVLGTAHNHFFICFFIAEFGQRKKTTQNQPHLAIQPAKKIG